MVATQQNRTQKQKGRIMRAKHRFGAFFLIIFISTTCNFAAEKTINQHTEQITTSTHQYKIKMGGTLDEFNTADYLETYNDNMRLQSKFQPNEFLVIENIGTTDVINPRIVVNGRRNWFSADDILNNILTPNMTDAEKAMAVYSFFASHKTQAHENDRRPGPEVPDDNSNPSRNTFGERADPVKSVNSYYCGGCQYESANVAILCRQAGFPARAVWLNDLDKYGSHCLAEVFYDNDWHLFDADQRTFYLESDNKTVASYKDLHENPSLVSRNHDGGFASKGLKNRSSQYQTIFPPHVMAVENWLSTMAMTLRPGEKFIRRWDNIGKYRGGANKRNIKPSRPQGLLPYQLANGKIVYKPKLNDPELFHKGIVSELNIEPVLADGKTKLQPIDANFPAFVIYKVTSPYPIVGGRVSGKFFRKTKKDKCKIYISVHDSDWKKTRPINKIGQSERSFAIDDFLNPIPTPPIYHYYLKFQVQADKAPQNVSMTDLYIETDVQMAATSLPSLSVDENTIVYSDDSTENPKVSITHSWTESSETAVPITPPAPLNPKDSTKIDLASLKQLSWKPAKDPDGQILDYHIQLSPSSDMRYPLSTSFDRIISSAEPKWSVPEGWFTKNKTYYWRVRAKDNFGAWSNWSNIWKFTIK